MKTAAYSISLQQQYLRPIEHIPAAPRPSAQEEFTLRSLLTVFRRRLPLFLLVFLSISGAAVLAALLMEPKYTAQVELKIDPNQKSVVEAQTRPDQVATAFVDTEIAVARSRKVAEAVVRKLRLARDAEFGAAGGDFDESVDNVLKSLNVSRQGATYMVDLNFTSADPEKAARIANAFAQEYIGSSVGLRMQTIEMQASALESSLNKLQSDAQSAYQSAAAYRASTGLVDASAGATIIQQQASTIAAQLSAAEADFTEARSNLSAAQARVQGADGGRSKLLDSPVIQDLQRQRAEVVRVFAVASSNYGPQHPQYQATQKQLQALDAQIAAENDRIIASLNTAQEAAASRVNGLRSTLAELQGRLNASMRTRAIADNLDRQAHAKEEFFNQSNLAQLQASQQKNVGGPQGLIVSTATAPASPSFPNKPLFGVLGGLSGLVIACGVVLLAEILDSRLMNRRDIEERLGQPLLASMPYVAKSQLKKGSRGIEPGAYVLAKPLSAYAEAFRSLRNAIMLGPTPRSRKIIAMTSALPGEGKTTTTLAFARILGMGGFNVVVLDCDLRRSSLKAGVSNDRSVGLLEILTEGASCDDAIVKDKVPRVSILPLLGASLTPQDVFNSGAFPRLLAELRGRYDFILLDSPPILAAADARTIAQQADCVVMLCRWSSTPRAAAVAALDILAQDRTPVAGVVLNGVRLNKKAYMSETDAAYYFERYRKYYSQ